MSQKIIGIDLGGTSIKFAILTTAGEIQEKWSIKTNILEIILINCLDFFLLQGTLKETLISQLHLQNLVYKSKSRT